MKKNKTVVISLMKRDANILAGQEIRWGRIAKALAESGDFNVIILCTHSIWKSWAKYGLGELTNNVRVFSEHPNKYITWITAQYFALREIPRGAFLHIPGPGWLIAPAAIISKFLKGTEIITSLTTCRLKPLKKVSYREYIVSLTLSRMSKIVDSLNPQIDLDGLIPEEKISISPCSFSDPHKYVSAEVKNQKVVFAGHLQLNKGVEILINIVKMWPMGGEFELVICGASTISEEVQGYTSEIKQLSVGKNITITQTDNMAEVFADAKVFLSLQTWDNYPSQSLIEAMLSGCNIVATSVGDTSLLVKEPWGKMLDLKASAEEYLDAVNHFLTLSDDAQKISGQAARNFILENHTVERYISYLKTLWTKL